MSTTEKKATDVILEMNSKVDKLLLIFQNLDFNLKVLSNRVKILSDKIDILEKSSNKQEVKKDNKIIAQVADIASENKVFISNNDAIEVDENPRGIRRDNRITDEFTGPLQVPVGNSSKFISPQQQNNEEFTGFKNKINSINKDNVKPIIKQVEIEQEKEIQKPNENLITVSQRVLNEHGKAEFFADITIHSLPDLEKIKSTRTTGVGLWNVMIPKGQYRVSVKTKKSINIPSKTHSFDINIKGTSLEVKLNDLIIS